MNTLLNDMDEDEDDHVRRHASAASDREITLGTTMILLIFFALAVYGAALFGFGYSMGSKHNAGGAAAATIVPGAAFNTAKPSPGSSFGSSAEKPPANTTSAPLPMTPPPVTKTVPIADASTKAVQALEPVVKPVPASAAPPPTVSSAPVAVAPGAVSLVVQVAAVSHQEDADMMAAALQHRGYVVNVRSEADKLIHVQVGPFASRKDAEAMRTRLLADGFNAYIK